MRQKLFIMKMRACQNFNIALAVKSGTQLVKAIFCRRQIATKADACPQSSKGGSFRNMTNLPRCNINGNALNGQHLMQSRQICPSSNNKLITCQLATIIGNKVIFSIITAHANNRKAKMCFSAFSKMICQAYWVDHPSPMMHSAAKRKINASLRRCRLGINKLH